MSLFYVIGGIEESDIVLTEGQGVGVFGVEELAALPLPPFVRRAIDSNLRGVLRCGPAKAP